MTISPELLRDITIAEQRLPNGDLLRVVDGPKVRDRVFVDFALGGNWHRYPKFVPKGEYWVEPTGSLEDMADNSRHEIRETARMAKHKPYVSAHTASAKDEEQDRGGQQMQKISRELVSAYLAGYMNKQAVDAAAANPPVGTKVEASNETLRTAGDMAKYNKMQPIIVNGVLKGYSAAPAAREGMVWRDSAAGGGYVPDPNYVKNKPVQPAPVATKAAPLTVPPATTTTSNKS